MSTKSSAKLLQKAWARRQKTGAFSLRGLATKMEISPSFLSAVFSGKKSLPPKHLAKLGAFLDMDAISVEQLKETLLLEQTPAQLKPKLRATFHADPIHEVSPRSDYALLQQWYFIALLDLTTCHDFRDDPEWIGKRLGIATIHARQAWQILRQLGCVEEREGRWTKRLAHMRFPTRSSEPALRHYHGQMLGLARKELERSSQEAFDARLISGLSVAVNPDKIAEAKLLIQSALSEAGKILTEGACTQVYQLQVQLFPVTKMKSENA